MMHPGTLQDASSLLSYLMYMTFSEFERISLAVLARHHRPRFLLSPLCPFAPFLHPTQSSFFQKPMHHHDPAHFKCFMCSLQKTLQTASCLLFCLRMHRGSSNSSNPPPPVARRPTLKETVCFATCSRPNADNTTPEWESQRRQI